MKDWILKSEISYRYQLLSRLRMDCDYYLGYGNRYAPHLWAQNEQDQITSMKQLWESFAEDDKPEWLTWEQILDYERKMCAGEEEEEEQRPNNRRVLITTGISHDDALIILTDAPASEIEKWCRHYNEEAENGQNTFLDTLAMKFNVELLFDSVVNMNKDIETIGYDEIYDIFDY